MESIIGPILLLSLLDMLNLSAVAVTIYLLLTSARYSTGMLGYAAGMFTTSFGCGLALMLGLQSVGQVLESPVAYAIEGVLGAVLFGYSWIMPRTREGETSLRTPRSPTPAALFVLGATVTLVEMITAVRYFGAIALMTRAELAATQWLPILLLYNVLFVTPPVALTMAYIATGRALKPYYERLGRWISRNAREGLSWALGAIGLPMMLDAAVHFEFFGLIDLPDAAARSGR
ncbi:MAG: GAP family protein [Thermomicrobium sp.]|nr:GAP family protein [Thermomicrobium sp.]